MIRQHSNVILIILGIAIQAISPTHQCLHSANIEPCTFEEHEEITITCINITDLQTTRKILHGIRGCTVNLHFIGLELKELPRGLFIGTSISTLVFKDFVLHRLTEDTPGPSPFLGLENTLHTLGVVGSKFPIQNWNWKEFNGLRALRTLSFGRGNISEVNKTFSQINNSSLTRLQLTVSLIFEIEDGAFTNFHELELIDLQANMLINVQRSIFPMPATKLNFISLSNNRLSTLYYNTFSKMPALKKIYLDGNIIKTIQENLFIDIWDQLDYLKLYDNPICCDCKLQWMLKRKVIYEMEDKPLMCKHPGHLAGNSIRYLDSKKICDFKIECKLIEEKESFVLIY